MLGLLAEAERSGYDLLKRAERSVGHMWTPAKSQLYAVLPRLVESGLAKRRVVRQRSRPDKQVYRLTRAGREAVGAWLEQSPAGTFDELLLKVFFAALMSREVLLRHLADRRRAEEELLEEYRAIEREIAADPARRHGYMTLRYGLELAATRIAWLDRTREELG